ncbi:Glucoamylase (glucan-1,4-alpha-glucosidase), GH15 family [Austwickia chelonae]|uniref:Putative glycoside hydrolase n=1 Tax=Austwickia chelonae NBRC 105200 TaxID=1184607 RepID=K6V9N3_9MICO|nr:glycoside hydrolase family 15 protein [Austwickia chelonae]GAB78943.1 putative glycoside hydrolase [Austwickia chelonae NBRC 105200]SEV87017.1 Glucoamylase (glucan-1,4-alpha-glucosidase), GH15 family [Austwickia chelonae]
MTTAIEDYAFIGDRHTGALISPEGSLDWLCLPNFDSPACFASLLGTEEHGRWLLSPQAPARTSRRYLPDSLVLETVHETDTGVVRVTDLMPEGSKRADVLRRIEGVRGEMRIRHEWRVRPWYGRMMPLVQTRELHGDTALVAVCGPDRFTLRGPRLPVVDDDGVCRDVLVVRAGEVMDFHLTWQASHRPPGRPVDLSRSIEDEVAEDSSWVDLCQYQGPYREQVRRSLLVLRHLTHARTGGMVAALTTSLPEEIGGERNWDYRYCWLRDSALTLEALLRAGFRDKAALWRDWLIRAVAGDPTRMQIMYRIDAGFDLPERVLDHLPGYAGSRPVRIGNGAVDQRQTDVLGEVMIALEQARRAGVHESALSACLQVELVDDLARHWREADNGIWEIRGPLRRFTHSQVMVWVVMDIALRAVEAGDLPATGDVATWQRVRDQVRAEVDAHGVSPTRGCFVQHDATEEVDASLLLLPVVGFCSATDPRFVATVQAVEEDLLRDGMVLRYRTSSGVDGLSGAEDPFLICCFWLVTAYARMGRLADAEALMDRLVSLPGDLGLFAEQSDANGVMLGNFPQAFSHLGLILSAYELDDARASARQGG